MSGLPPNVRELVDEIEREIGEDGHDPADGPQSEIEGALRGQTDDEHGAEAVEFAVRQILREIGEDPERQGLQRTPERVHRMYQELTAGYHVDPDRLPQHPAFGRGYR